MANQSAELRPRDIRGWKSAHQKGRAEEREALWEAQLARSMMGTAVLQRRENGQVVGALQLLANNKYIQNNKKTAAKPEGSV